MNRFTNTLAVLGVAASAAACADQPVAPLAEAPEGVSFARGSASTSACAVAPDFVATDEAGLRAAMASAQAGDVIGIDGMIQLTENLWVETAGLTFTCASAGSGLAGVPGPDMWALFGVLAEDITIKGLVLDGGPSRAYPVYAVNNGVGATAGDITFTGNQVRCGPGCMFIVGAAGSVILDNHFEAEFAGTGIHLQGFQMFGGPRLTIDGTRVERNTLVALRPIGNLLFGAIRPRDGRAIVVADNVVTGPWSNGIGVAEVQDTRVERNRVEGARQFGLFISSNPFEPISTSGSLFRANHLSAGAAAIQVRRACGNVISGNVLGGDAEWGVVFEQTTGSNAFLGRGASVMDDGAMDCDGDGQNDPNQITGAGRQGSGGAIGAIVSDVLPKVGGHEIR